MGLPHLHSSSVSPFAASTSRPHSGQTPIILRVRGLRSMSGSMRSQAWMSHVSQCPERLARHRSGSRREQGLPSRTAFHAGLVPHVLQAVLGLVEHVLRVEVDGRGRVPSLRSSSGSRLREPVFSASDRLEEVQVDAQPVQQPRVPAPARLAQRPRRFGRLIAVLAVPIHFYAPSADVYGHIKAYKGA